MNPETAVKAPANTEVDRLVSAWVSVWNTYDLNELMPLFLKDPRLTYFSSEKAGLIRGPEAVAEHHRGFGFVEGGKSAVNKLWLEDISYTAAGEATVITALWYFQRPTGPRQWGPVTFVSVCEQGRHRFLHVHFANYAPVA